MPFDNSLKGHQGFITAGLLLDDDDDSSIQQCGVCGTSNLLPSRSRATTLLKFHATNIHVF